jgi:hypothetical protein
MQHSAAQTQIYGFAAPPEDSEWRATGFARERGERHHHHDDRAQHERQQNPVLRE